MRVARVRDAVAVKVPSSGSPVDRMGAKTLSGFGRSP